MAEGPALGFGVKAGVPLAAGLIVGEGLLGVVFAGVKLLLPVLAAGGQ